MIRTALLIASIVIFPAIAGAQAHYAKNNIYALHPEPINMGLDQRYVRYCFVPKCALLFNKRERKFIRGEYHFKYETREGVTVWAPKSAVSNKAVTTNFTGYCAIHKNIKDMDGNDIKEGFWLLTETTGDSSIIEISASLENTAGQMENRNHRIRKADLDKAMKNGLASDTTWNKPVVTVSCTRIDLFSTKPGSVYPYGYELISNTGNEKEKIIAEIFQVANFIDEDNCFVLSRELGSSGKSLDFKYYEFVDAQGKRYDFVAKIEMLCDDDNRCTIIDCVKIKGVKNNLDVVLKFDDFITPANLRQDTQTPYLYSINKAADYFTLLENLIDKFGSKELTLYFMAEFNRTCHSDIRDERGEEYTLRFNRR